MAWTWRFEKADGTEVPPAVQPEEFTTQGDAESWVGEIWKELLDGGADQVVLFEGETRIYGPMSLHGDQQDEPQGEPQDEPRGDEKDDRKESGQDGGRDARGDADVPQAD